MPRHELEMIKLLVIATPLVKTVINDVLGPFPIFSRKGSTYRLVKLINVRLKSFKTSYFISFCIFEEKKIEVVFKISVDLQLSFFDSVVIPVRVSHQF